MGCVRGWRCFLPKALTRRGLGWKEERRPERFSGLQLLRCPQSDGHKSQPPPTHLCVLSPQGPMRGHENLTITREKPSVTIRGLAGCSNVWGINSVTRMLRSDPGSALRLSSNLGQ